MGAFAKVLVSIGQAVSKKESRDVLLLVLFIPLFLIVAFASVFNGIFISKDNKEDIFNIVIAEFKKENHIENNLQSNTAKTMYYFMHDEMTQDKVTIKRYINDYFYDGSRFLDCGEIMRMAKRNLHDLTDDEMLVAVRYIDESDPIWIGGKYPMPFGTRIEKSYNPDKFYNGVSLYGKLHDKVIAIEDGEVVEVDEGGSMGNFIIIKHTKNNKTFYTFSAHLIVTAVTVGQQVTQGQTIAFQGNEYLAGNEKSPTIYFEVWKKYDSESHVDPASYLKG